MRVMLDDAFPVSVLSGKNACSFSSLRSSDGVSAQQENKFLRLTFVEEKMQSLRCGRADGRPCCSC